MLPRHKLQSRLPWSALGQFVALCPPHIGHHLIDHGWCRCLHYGGGRQDSLKAFACRPLAFPRAKRRRHIEGFQLLRGNVGLDRCGAKRPGLPGHDIGLGLFPEKRHALQLRGL